MQKNISQNFSQKLVKYNKFQFYLKKSISITKYILNYLYFLFQSFRIICKS